MESLLDTLYRDHLAVLQARTAEALRRSGHDHLLIAAGVEKYHFLDDRPYPFQINPHFKHWLPLCQHPHSWLVITPGERPRLIYFQPDDYWHLPPAAPEGYWTEHFDLQIIREATQARALLPDPRRAAIVGEADAALDGVLPNNPEPLLHYLHFHRGMKTGYELELLRAASRRAVRGHRAAAAAFRGGESELGIHRAYLQATGHNDLDLPYGNIVGLNEHAAVLHYQYQDAEPPPALRSFLIDAGASHAGYAADITRTYSFADDEFAALIAAVDRVQLNLVAQVRAGVAYPDLHLDSHLQLAGVLQQAGIVRMAPTAMVEHGITATFFPHGIGHLLGLQVHDVAGFQRDDHGGRIERPPGHPFLRLTRSLQPGMVVTIEPGLYFIPSLLERLRAGPQAAAVDWTAISHFQRYGGIRIEDDVLCTEAVPENLSREAFTQSA